MDMVVYETRWGRVPFQKWLNKLKDHEGRAIINTRLDRVQTGSFGDCNYLRDGIWELRIHFGPGYRVYFSKLEQETVILLLLGGLKKTQERDIEQAMELFFDFKKRYDI